MSVWLSPRCAPRWPSRAEHICCFLTALSFFQILFLPQLLKVDPTMFPYCPAHTRAVGCSTTSSFPWESRTPPAAFWYRSLGLLLSLSPTPLCSSTALGVPEPRAELQTPKNRSFLPLSPRLPNAIPTAGCSEHSGVSTEEALLFWGSLTEWEAHEEEWWEGGSGPPIMHPWRCRHRPGRLHSSLTALCSIPVVRRRYTTTLRVLNCSGETEAFRRPPHSDRQRISTPKEVGEQRVGVGQGGRGALKDGGQPVRPVTSAWSQGRKWHLRDVGTLGAMGSGALSLHHPAMPSPCLVLQGEVLLRPPARLHCWLLHKGNEGGERFPCVC